MVSDRLLQIAFVVSLLIHSAIFIQSPSFNALSPKPKNQIIEVSYIKESLEVNKLPSNQSKLNMQKFKQDPFLKLDAKITAGRRIPPPYIQPSKGAQTLPDKLSEFPKPDFNAPDLMIVKKKISLPPIEMAKIDNPSYINYYQIVREKIRRSAYQNYTQNETGEVYVSFIISNDGYIRGVRLVDEKTTANDYLRSIALRSVKDASPFPNFPKELDYPQLSFNIIISFEIE